MKVAVIAVISANGEKGGAENFYDGLVSALTGAGVEADLINVVSDESGFDAIQETLLHFYDLNILHYDGVISTRAPAYLVRHHNHICYLQHTMRVFYDMFEFEFKHPSTDILKQREFIQKLDTLALSYPRTKKIFVIGNEVRNRLLKYNNLDSEVLYQGLRPGNFREGEYNYIFMPGRLHRWKRVDLIIKAMKYVTHPVLLNISGTGEDGHYFKTMAKGDERIKFLGRVSEEELGKLYSNALVVPFVPIREDFGLVTMEAFKSGKPVITCEDSGEPSYLIKNDETGFICKPEPQEIAEKINYLYENPEVAKKMGGKGRLSIEHITWESTAERLIDALKVQLKSKPSYLLPLNLKKECKILVLDMQPIDPPVGGGRLRLLGLYHNPGNECLINYVGTYDWPGEKFRDHQLTQKLREINIPLSSEHFSAAEKIKSEVGGKTVIDVTFHKLVHLSQDYIKYVKDMIPLSDVIIFSHPWVFPPVRDEIDRSEKLVIYDSHNVESFLRYIILDDSGNKGTELVKEVVKIEYELCHFADFIFACSHEDRELFNKLYKVAFEKIRIAPNGVFTSHIKPFNAHEKSEMKKKLNLSKSKTAIFMGSNYEPNIEGAVFICDKLAPSLPEINFIIAGSVGEGIEGRDYPHNVFVTGFLSDEKLKSYLSCSDFAINPMFSGSGTNIKMFDFMAAGLPIISTPTGARGIDEGPLTSFIVCEKEEFASCINKLLNNDELYLSLSRGARKLGEEKYSWERISMDAGKFIRRKWLNKKNDNPFYSIIIPSYERHGELTRLIESLLKQSFKGFEVIIVDQSEKPWHHKNKDFPVDIFYIHTDIKGTVKARNRGAFFARGEVMAFIDDDCIPDRNWLKNSYPYFFRKDIAGLEGLIKSDKLDDPSYRTVSNENFRGMGFMTANLFIRTEIFNKINGFDERFDEPHFREDTDLAWRAMDFGSIPFAEDVQVYHPPHKRDTERESLAERNKFFEKDALLLKKHPDRYRDLFISESQWEKGKGFRDNFLRGIDKYNVKLPEFYKDYMSLTSNEEEIQ